MHSMKELILPDAHNRCQAGLDLLYQSYLTSYCIDLLTMTEPTRFVMTVYTLMYKHGSPLLSVIAAVDYERNILIDTM